MKRFIYALLATTFSFSVTAFAADTKNPQVRMTTSEGVIELELYPAKAPITVKNFLEHVDAGFYNGTLFHRVIPAFMIQGGGFEPGMKEKTNKRAAIKNEADNGLKNTLGTIAMARTSDPHSATAEFFINTKDNGFLDHTSKTMQGWGYAVFGKVTKGLDVVKKIENVKTSDAGPHGDVPVKNVIIQKVERLGAK